MTTIRDLLTAGFDPDTEILMYRSEDDDVAYGTVHEVRHTDALNAATVIVLSATNEYAVIADEDDDELEWQAAKFAGEANPLHPKGEWQRDEFGRDIDPRL